MSYPIGTPVTELDTPALLVDSDVLIANITKMAEFFAGKPVCLRPHFKTHKTPMIAHLQLSRGAIGITCAKLGEAETLVHSGIGNILIANQIVTQRKMNKLAGLARSADIAVCVDSQDNLTDLSAAATQCSSTIGICIEVDVGMDRSGTRTTADTVLLAKTAQGLPGLKLWGLVGYEGHCVITTPREKRERMCRQANEILKQHTEAVRSAGIPCPIVSGGGTGTFDISSNCDVITEIQAGSYVFMDTTYAEVVNFDHSLTLLTTVISKPDPDTIIIDAGLKAITKEFGLPRPYDLTNADVIALSEEHGHIKLATPRPELTVGARIKLVPTHCCTTVNLHDELFIVKDDKLIDVWAVAGRGRCR